MARPADLEKRSELARGAVEVLRREGVDIAMASLADAIGVKRPTLLYHFPTKAHIVEHALIELLVEQAAFVREEIERHSHPIDRLNAHLVAIHAFHKGNEARFVFLTQAIAATAGLRLPEIVAVGAQVFEAHRADIVRRLREGVREGLVGECEPEALFATIRALTDGLLVQRVVTRVDLGGVQKFVWENLLLPLRREPEAAASRGPRAARRRTA